ncbi:MAG TPA: DUF3127 domain-containing protein [Bacteroidaceae bacterium]|nr:DUF3127 domain-containing protein [Bacteroidaceae bacterium]
MELSGKIIAVLEERGGISKSTGNEWKVQEYVLETQEQYPHRMLFSIFGADKIKQANIKAGDEVTVSFDINCREYNGRWFNDIRAWKIEHLSTEVVQKAEYYDDLAEKSSDSKGISSIAEGDKDDLPF